MSSKPKDHTKTIATMKTVIADLKKNVNKITKEKEKADTEKEQQVSPEEHKAALDHFASQYKMAKVNKDEAAASEHAKAYHAYAAKLNAHYHSKLKEDVEQVDEISKELANRYMHSAFSDRKRTDDKMFTLRDRQDTLGHNNRNKITKLLKKSDKRTTGISRALNRITKEEIEICNQCKSDPCICDESHGFVNEDWVQTGKTGTHMATGKKTFEWAKVNKEGKRTGERHYRTADGKILGEEMNPYKLDEGKMGEKAAGDLDFNPEFKNRGKLSHSDSNTMSKVAALMAKERAAKAAKKPVKEEVNPYDTLEEAPSKYTDPRVDKEMKATKKEYEHRAKHFAAKKAGDEATAAKEHSRMKKFQSFASKINAARRADSPSDNSAAIAKDYKDQEAKRGIGKVRD